MTKPDPEVWLRDLDGTGSMHVCAAGDPGAVPYVIYKPDARPLRLCGYCRSWQREPCGAGCVWSPSDPTAAMIEASEAQ